MDIILLWFIASPLIIAAWFLMACVAMAMVLVVFLAMSDGLTELTYRYHRWLNKRRDRQHRHDVTH